LTPQRLATFYSKTGGYYDRLFLDTENPGISYIYRTLGCRHSLQPTQSDYETPSIPCLTDAGFARWQALQLLHCPEVAARTLQRAVEIYDVPRPDGGIFPKVIPSKCFPTMPDEEFEKWYNGVMTRIDQESQVSVNHMHRLKNRAYHSAHPEHHSRRDSYLDPNGRPMHASRSHSASRDELARQAAMHRRRSVPDVVSSLAADGDGRAHWHPSTHLDTRGRENWTKARSHSASRPLHTRQRSSTTPVSPLHAPTHYPSATDRRHGSKQTEPTSHSSSSRPPSSYAYAPARRERSRGSDSRHRPPSALDDDTGSEASSENSYYGRHSSTRKAEDDRPRRHRSISFWPPPIFGLQRRRNSSDTSPPPRAIEARRPPAPSPLRPEYYQSKHAKVASLRPGPGTAPAVRFRDDICMDNISAASGQHPNLPPSYYQPQQPPPLPPSSYAPHPSTAAPPTRYSDVQPQYPTQQLENMAVNHPLRPPRRPSASAVPSMRLPSASGPGGRP
ncbi:hypothetical protein DV736_g6538, partial [Chaetothyriales sp. CBS 134916]